MKVQAAWMNQTFRFTFYSAQVFSSDIWEILKNTFWEHSIEHSLSSKVLFVNCLFVVVWYHSYLRIFVESVMVIFKRMYEVKKISNLKLLDTWYNFLLLYLYLDTIYCFYTYIWGIQCKWKTSGSLWTRKKLC